MDTKREFAAAAAQIARIVRNPTSKSSQKRYEYSMKLYQEWLLSFGVDPNDVDFSASRDPEEDPVYIACALILFRCGPKEEGFEELKAMATDGAIKSAVVAYWNKRGINVEYVLLPDRRFSGNLGNSPNIQALIRRLDEAQRLSRAKITRRAYQETHEDLRAIYATFVKRKLSGAVRRYPTVDYAKFQAACVNRIQFHSVLRGAEMLDLKEQDLIFTGKCIASPVVGVLPVIKNRKEVALTFGFHGGWTYPFVD